MSTASRTPNRRQWRWPTGPWRAVVLAMTAASVVLVGCGDDVTQQLPRNDEGMPIIDLLEPVSTSAFGSRTEVASFEPRQVVEVRLPMIDFEMLADGVTLYSPFDVYDLTKPRTQANPNPINEVELGVITTDDIGEVFDHIDDAIAIFGVDESAGTRLAEIREILEATSARTYDRSNVFTSDLRVTDDYQVYVRVRRFHDDDMRLTITVTFFNGVYDGSVGRWPLDDTN